MKTQTVNTFKFAELSDAVKATVIDKVRYSESYLEHDWYESNKEDFHHILEIIGFCDVSSQFTGFYSQGDGASFSGTYTYTKGFMKALKAYAPKDEELHSIAQRLINMQKKYNYLVECEVHTRGYYSHSGTMSFNYSKVFSNSWDFEFKESSHEDDFDRIFRDLADWYYSRLENQHDFLMSDEAVIEHINAQDQDYLVTGEEF